MRLTCYIYGCDNVSRELGFLVALCAVIEARSFHPYVCKEHRDLFSDELEAEARRIGAIGPRRKGGKGEDE